MPKLLPEHLREAFAHFNDKSPVERLPHFWQAPSPPTLILELPLDIWRRHILPSAAATGLKTIQSMHQVCRFWNNALKEDPKLKTQEQEFLRAEENKIMNQFYDINPSMEDVEKLKLDVLKIINDFLRAPFVSLASRDLCNYIRERLQQIKTTEPQHFDDYLTLNLFLFWLRNHAKTTQDNRLLSTIADYFSKEPQRIVTAIQFAKLYPNTLTQLKALKENLMTRPHNATDKTSPPMFPRISNAIDLDRSRILYNYQLKHDATFTEMIALCKASIPTNQNTLRLQLQLQLLAFLIYFKIKPMAIQNELLETAIFSNPQEIEALLPEAEEQSLSESRNYCMILA